MSDSDSDGSMDLDGLYDTVVRTDSFLFTVCHQHMVWKILYNTSSLFPF